MRKKISNFIRRSKKRDRYDWAKWNYLGNSILNGIINDEMNDNGRRYRYK